ncbi:MAG: hypothetical protein GY769_03165 [bacterium]|nr:hypothetical protein [bacterium]
MLRFAAIAIAVTVVLLVAGTLLTCDAAPGARESMIWACGVVFLGSILGAVPLISGAGAAASAGPAGVSRFLAAMLVRLGAVGIGAVAVVLLGEVEVAPFLLWLAVSYLVFLIVDTAFALRVFRRL